MTAQVAEITIGLDPEVRLGPVTLAWHGLTIAVGILLGTLVAARYARTRELDPGRVQTLVMILVVAGIAGSRLLYLGQHDPAGLVNPADWVGTRGFSFYGALVAAPAAVALYLRRGRLTLRYLDALAAGFPLGMAAGRVGDLINGEHHGGVTDAPWGVRYTNPDAEVPEPGLVYHSGGLYEIVLALAMAALLTPLWGRLRSPTALLFATTLLYSVGRFFMFFARDDSGAALGLKGAQWLSLAIAVASGIALWRALRRNGEARTPPPEQPAGSHP
jgi:phosphatidylglycerol---prolipoprotein diacylglyceryl transferase